MIHSNKSRPGGETRAASKLFNTAIVHFDDILSLSLMTGAAKLGVVRSW